MQKLIINGKQFFDMDVDIIKTYIIRFWPTHYYAKQATEKR